MGRPGNVLSILRDDKDDSEGTECTYIKRTRLENICLGGGARSKEKTSFTSVSVGGGVVDFCQSELWGTLTSLNMLLQSIHKDTKKGMEGCLKKKRQGS